nr:O-antigen ligase family protein [uncultured Eisenbergiella sp.]
MLRKVSERPITISLGDMFILLYLLSFQLAGNGTGISKIMKVICAMVFIPCLIKNKKKMDAFAWWVIVYFIYVFMSKTWALYNDYAKDAIYTVFFTMFCTYVCTQFFLKSKYNRIYYAKVSVFLPFIHYVYYILSNPVQNMFNLREGWLDQSYNNIGLYASFSVFFILAAFSENAIKHKNIYKFMIIMDIFLIVVSQSRKAILYILIGIAVYYIVKSKNIFRSTLKFFVAALAVVCFYFIARFGYLGHYMQDLIYAIEGSGTDSSYIGRINQVDISMSLFNKNKFGGCGIGAIEYVCRFKHGQRAPIVDCDYLDLLADLGIIGLILFYGMFLYTLFLYLKCFSTWREIDRVCFAILIVLFFNGIVIRTYFNNYCVILTLFYVYKNIVDLKQCNYLWRNRG